MDRMDKYFKWKNKNQNNNFIFNIIKDNIFKIAFLFVVVFGLLYMFIYYLKFSFFPILSSEEFIQLSLLYFTTIIFLSVILTLLFFMPGEQIYQMRNNPNIPEKIFAFFMLIIVLSIPFSYAYFLVKYLRENHIGIINFFKTHTTFLLIIIFLIIFVAIFNIIYYQAKQNNNTKNIGLILLIVWIIISTSLAPFFSTITTNLFHLGNYNSTIIVDNKLICNKFFKIKDKYCTLNAKVIWNMGNDYLVEINNTIYKIPNKYILSEHYLQKNQTKSKH